MINEIAGHYATIVENVVDAYEINADLQGIPPDAVPIIVHLFPDTAVAHTAKLVLFDVELHAHNSEPGFRLGPKTQRFVLPVPEWIDRASVLTLANSDVYCQMEGDRCFVWHGNQRWQDTDLHARRIAHGDYFRVALPPTERFTCTTQQIVEWTQNGLSDTDILHRLAGHEGNEGYSPSLLDEEEVRQLATVNIEVEDPDADHFSTFQIPSDGSTTTFKQPLQDVTNFFHDVSKLQVGSHTEKDEGDLFLAMQNPLREEAHNHEVDTLSSSGSSGDRHLQEWNLDLQRLVQQHVNGCTPNRPEEEELLFSVYTWFIDHQSGFACFQPRIAFLGGDPAEWREDLTHPWRYQVIPDEPLFIDVVSHFTPRAEIEEHIAHVLLSQGAQERRSTLVSLEFLAPVAPSVIVRCAVAVPNPCTRHDIGYLFPLFARISDESLVWLHPEAHQLTPQFGTWNGMGIILQVLPEQEVMQDAPPQDLNSLVQVDASKKRVQVDVVPEPACSFTDEFLEAISAAEEAARMEPPVFRGPNELAMANLPEAFRTLSDRFAEEVITTPAQMSPTRRIESWFLDHASFTRCHSSRISLLSADVLTWRHVILDTWRDRISDAEQIDFHVVDPTPEDAAIGTIGQLIVTQRASSELRSIVLSVYDSDPDMERSPYTFAFVLHRRVNLERLLAALQLTSDCPPVNRHNHCSLWFGRLPIDDALVVNVHMGQAFRLVIGRGIAIDIAHLLQMDDVMLRDTLQRSASTEIYMRPNEPDFLHPDNAAFPSQLPFVIPDGRPGWIPVLQQHFDRLHWRDSLDAGPYLVVFVWYLNAHPHFHCGAPHLIRISDDPLVWRAELMTSWRDHLLRASPADFFVLPGVLTGTPAAQQEEHSTVAQEVHVLVHQALPIDVHGVLITLRGVASLQVLTRRFAHVLRSREAVSAILRLVVPNEHSHRPAMVQYEGCTYLPGEQLLLHTGSHLVVEISPHAIDLYSDQIAEDVEDVNLFQQVVTCKPAEFQEPDDFPVSLPTSNLPRRARPKHDGEFEWSIQFGHLMQLHGDLDPWSDTLSMEVTTWYVDHLRAPICHQSRNMRMSGHAITWIEDLRHLWADRLDPNREFSIYLVQPRPPHFRVQRSTCHFLLEQGKTPGHEALVLTALLEGYTNEGIIQGAFSIGSRTHLADVIRTMEIAHFCAGKRCTIIQFPHLLIEDQWFDVASGQSLRVRIEPQEERQEDFDIDTVPFEDLSLMQTAGCFQFNPQAAPFIPGQTPIQMQPEVIQDLHAVWAIATSQQAATSKAAVFSTWFVSPGTGRSRCQFSRRATLFDDFLQWFEILRRTWHDLLDPGVPFQVVLVQPAPEPMESGVVGHVILIQHLFDTMSALLVTVKDVAINVGHPNRIVVNVPENIAKRDLLQSVGYERDCHLKGASCQIRHALAAWDAQVLWPVRDGDCFYVQITRAFLPAEWHPPLPFQELGSDGLGLLQVHSRTVKQPSEHPRKGHRMRSERSPSHVLLIAWFVDENHPVCRMPKIKEVDSSACLVKQAEQLWIDTLGGRECQVFTVETMSRCVQSGSELDEVCFVIDGRTLPINADAEVAIVLERVLVAGNQHLVEHFAALVEPPSCAKLLWKHLLGRSGDPIPEATTCYLQGRNWDLNMVAHNLAPGSCVSFWLEQDKLAEKFVRITFKQVIIAFEWLDAHFFLPCYDLPVTFPFLPICYDWTNEWWEPNAGGTHVSIYFDGSYISNAEGTRAGAAAAAFVCVKGKWMFAGALSTALSNAKNSYQAETSASIIAMKFAYDILKLIGAVQNTALVDVHLCYDSLTVGKQSAGEWHAVPSPTVGHLLRSLHKCVQRRFRSELKYHHVKAHCGEPGNELVDTLAHQAALGAPLQDLEPWIAHVTARAFVSNAEWFWFLFRDDVSWDLNDLLLPAAPSTLPDTLHDSPPPILAQDCEQVGELMLTLTTCNVLTLVSCKKKGSQAFQGPARQESVFQQMADEQIHIFALQETRLKRLSNAHDSRFWLYRSAATSGGHYGVLIGLTRDRPVGFLHKDGVAKKVYIEQQDVAVIAVDPRYLILRLKTSLFKVILIAGHAPHTGSAQTEIDAWWSTVAGQIPTKYGTWPRILLCDANARVGAEPCPHIGPFQAEKGNGKEEGFIQFVRQQGLFLPSTFETCHVGDGGTWLHNNGVWCRNDFVGLPAEWTYDSCKSWVSTEIDVGLHKEDHRAPVVTFKRQVVAQGLVARPKPFKMNLPPLRPEHLPELPTYAWHLDVHTHAHQIQQDLINSLWDVQVKPGGVPRKTTMSTETWDIVCQKRHARNALASHQKAQRQTVLAAWFACWRHSLVDGFPSNLLVTFDELLCQQDSLIAVAYHRFRALGRLVVKRLRQDDVTFFDNLLQDCTEYLGPAQVKQLWKTVRRSLPRFQQRRMTTPPFQLEGLEDQWVNHFSQLEAGTPTSMPQLLRTCVTRQMCALFDAPSQIECQELPSLFALEDAFRKTAPDRATGDDPLPSELFHLAACPLAAGYHDLLLKEFVWQMEPLSYKGGPVAIIPKCLAPTTAQQFRGILLLGNMAKRTHSVLRQRIMSHLEHAKAPGQLGGFPGQQVMFGSQALRIFGTIADARRVSSAVLFLDLSNAFHHLVRELVTGVSSSQNLDAVLDVLKSTGHSNAKLNAACQLPGLLADLGAPSTLVRLVCDIHAETWCSLPCQQFLHTRRGTRPGSPLADIVFHILMTSVAKDIDEWIVLHSVHSPVFPGEVDTFPSILWADDIAVPVATSQPEHLVPLLLKLLCAVRDCLHDRGFTLNFALGKTNAVVSFRGSGASELRKEFQLVSKPGATCVFSDGTEAWLHFVPVYKHLGTIFASDHSLESELSMRIGIAGSAFSHLSRPLLTNRHLPTRLRLKLFQSLIVSKLFFGLGAWHTPTPKQLKRLTGFYIRCLKKILRLPIEKWAQSNEQVFLEAQMLDVRARLAVDRLLYAQRVFAVGPFFLQNVIHLEESTVTDPWLAGLKADLQWMQDIDPTVLPEGWSVDLTDLIDAWQTEGFPWRSKVKAVARKHRMQEQTMEEVASLHRQAFAVLKQAGATFKPDPFHIVPEACSHACFCGASFMSRRGLLAHQRRKHQLFSIERPFLQGTICLHCGRFCWTTQRLQQHLAYIPKSLGYNPCFHALSTQGCQVEYSAEKMPKQVVGLARREFLPTLGPRHEQQTCLDKQRRAWQMELDECFAKLVIQDQPENAMDRGARIGDALSEATQKWFHEYFPLGPSDSAKQDLVDTWIQILCIDFGDNNPLWDNWLAFVFLAWGDHWLPEIIAEFLDGEAEQIVDELYADFATELPRYQVLSRISFLESSLKHCVEAPPEPHRPAVYGGLGTLRHPKTTSRVYQPVPRAYGCQEAWLQHLRQCSFLDLPITPFCPRYKSIQEQPVFLVVHLFSGRRREGDFH